MALNTIPVPVRPANPVPIGAISPAARLRRVAVDSTVTCWTADHRAVKLLASCVALPPISSERRGRFGNSAAKTITFAGYRVEALEAIRLEIGDKLMLAYHRQGPDAYEPFQRGCEQPNASDAVAAVLASSTEH